MNFKKLFAVAALFVAPFAQAAYVTIDEAGLDAIFSQASFGSRTVDIRIGSVSQIVAPNLLDITTDAEISQLFGLHVGSAFDVNFYFVDTISACGGLNPNIIGCGELPGNDFVVESDFAAGPTGAQLLAHELGHNLGLAHVDQSLTERLMNPFLFGGTLLSAGEVAQLLLSPLVRTDLNGQRYININPVLIIASVRNNVPEPASLGLLFGALLAAGLGTRRATRSQI